MKEWKRETRACHAPLRSEREEEASHSGATAKQEEGSHKSASHKGEASITRTERTKHCKLTRTLLVASGITLYSSPSFTLYPVYPAPAPPRPRPQNGSVTIVFIQLRFRGLGRPRQRYDEDRRERNRQSAVPRRAFVREERPKSLEQVRHIIFIPASGGE